VLLRHLPLVPILGLFAAGVAVREGAVDGQAPGAQAALSAAAGVPDVVPLEVVSFHVVLDPGDPRRARSVTFDVARGAPRRIAIRTGGRTAACRLDGAHASCPLVPSVPIVALDAVEITAA
jgi:hypothetical protein